MPYKQYSRKWRRLYLLSSIIYSAAFLVLVIMTQMILTGFIGALITTTAFLIFLEKSRKAARDETEKAVFQDGLYSSRNWEDQYNDRKKERLTITQIKEAPLWVWLPVALCLTIQAINWVFPSVFFFLPVFNAFTGFYLNHFIAARSLLTLYKRVMFFWG